jgi:hypothetical protein
LATAASSLDILAVKQGSKFNGGSLKVVSKLTMWQAGGGNGCSWRELPVTQCRRGTQAAFPHRPPSPAQSESQGLRLRKSRALQSYT